MCVPVFGPYVSVLSKYGHISNIRKEGDTPVDRTQRVDDKMVLFISTVVNILT